MYWERRLDHNIETTHYRRTFGDILIHLEPPCFCDIEDKLSLLVSIPSPVLEQISLYTFILFLEKCWILRCLCFPSLTTAAPGHKTERGAGLTPARAAFSELPLCLMGCGWSGLPGPATPDEQSHPLTSRQCLYCRLVVG